VGGGRGRGRGFNPAAAHDGLLLIDPLSDHGQRLPYLLGVRVRVGVGVTSGLELGLGLG